MELNDPNHPLAALLNSPDQDHDLVEHLISYRAPSSDDVIARFDALRHEFKRVGHLVVDLCPRTPDRTVALRKIHDACMASIAALALNAEES
jgi:hypothetical protein